jgi:hypothetical protein
VGPDAIKQEQSVTFVDGPEGDHPPKPPHIRQDAILLSVFPTTFFDIQKLCCNTYALCLDDILQHGKHFIFIDGLGSARPPKPPHSRQIAPLLSDILLLREPSTGKLGLGGNNQGPTGLQRRATRWGAEQRVSQGAPKTKDTQKKDRTNPRQSDRPAATLLRFWAFIAKGRGESKNKNTEHQTKPRKNNPPWTVLFTAAICFGVGSF